MKPAHRTMLKKLALDPRSAAFRQIQRLAADANTQVDDSAPVQMSGEVLSVWSIRLWNATLRGRRFVGLADLVRTLMELGPDKKIQQLSFKNGPKLGVAFFDSETMQPIGAIISVRVSADERRSREAFSKAEGTFFPGVPVRAIAR